MLYHLSRLVFPLILSNILHMIAIKQGWFPRLNKPLNVRLFGTNKTWRGFLLVPLFNALFSAILVGGTPLWNVISVGVLLGLVYMLFELPNSAFKRRHGVGSGERPLRNRWFFLLLDKSDSSLGVSLTYYCIADITLFQAEALFFICLGSHILFSLLLVQLGMKRSF